MTLSFCYKYGPCASSEMYRVLIVLEYKLFLFFSAPLSLSSECYSLENTRFVFLFFQLVSEHRSDPASRRQCHDEEKTLWNSP